MCVESSARLHLGFYNFFEDGVAYGGLGVAIEVPRVRIRVERGVGFTVTSRVEGLELSDVVSRVREGLAVSGVSVTVEEAFPRHAGLGSTTQLALSIGYGISRLLNLGYSVRELAALLGRGRDSGVGVAAFEYGGFIVDGGRVVSGRVEPPKTARDIPEIIFRSSLPSDWYFIVITPHGVRGLDEVRERSAMDYPQPLPRDLQYELYKLLLLHIIPSVIRGDAEVFGRAVTRLQVVVGSYFSKFQGGVYCCREVEEIVRGMLEAGAYGAGQSSWGPTAYGITRGRDSAARILQKTLDRLERYGVECSYYIARARVGGASVEVC